MENETPSVTPEDPGITAVLDGVKSIAVSTEEMRKRHQQDMDQLRKESERRDADLREAMEKSTADLIARQNRQSQIFSVVGRELDIRPGNDSLNEVMPKEYKERAGVFEAFSRSMPKGSPLSDASVAACVNAYFQKMTRLQLPRHYAADIQENSKQRDTLWAALQERAFGPNWETLTKAAYAEGGATTGQTLVPTIVEPDILRQIKDSAKLFKLGRQVQMTSLTHDYPSESTSVTVGWASEAGPLTGTEGTLSKKTLTALKVYGRATMSIEMVEDSAPGFLNYLLEVFSERMGGELDKQLVLGDGAGPAITGIDNTSGINVVGSSATAAGRNATWQLLVNTYCAAGEGSAIENGVWVVSPKGYAVINGLSDSTGFPIIKYDDTLNAPAGRLLGRPIVLSARFGGAPVGVTATLDDTTNANTKILYGVPSSLLCGTRMGMRWDVSDQVNWGSFSMDARLVGRFAMIVGIPANWSRLSKVNS